MINKVSILPNKSNHIKVMKVDEFLKSKIFRFSTLSLITGINQRQLQAYSSGARKPQQRQFYRINAGLRSIADELNSISLE